MGVDGALCPETVVWDETGVSRGDAKGCGISGTGDVNVGGGAAVWSSFGVRGSDGDGGEMYVGSSAIGNVCDLGRCCRPGMRAREGYPGLGLPESVLASEEKKGDVGEAGPVKEEAVSVNILDIEVVLAEPGVCICLNPPNSM